MASTTTETTKQTIRYYVWIPEFLGAPVTREEEEAACERAETWLTEHEGDTLSISVRMPRIDEARGLYEEWPGGRLQILGYSVEKPADVDSLTERAYQHALETWPNA